MGLSRDYVALDWVKSEIETTLEHARQALEAYIDTPDSTRMRSCLTYIHQVHGTLQMVELHGLAELSDEMEQLAQAMMNNDVEDSESVQQALMQSIVQLPTLLDKVQRGGTDSSNMVRPFVNELRTARGASLLEVAEEPDHDEESVDLSSLRREANAATVSNFDNANGQVRAQKMRRAFQQSLLALHRGEGFKRVYINLAKLFIALARLCAGSPLGYQWAAFAALAEGLANGAVELDDRVIRLLRRVDSEIKKLALSGHDAVVSPVDETLMSEVLKVLASVKELTSVQRDLLERFAAQAGRSGTGVESREAVAAVAASLREELGAVLDKIDLFVRSSDRDHASLETLIPSLKQMATSLMVAGLSTLQRRLMEQMVLLQAFTKKGGDDSKLMDIAAGLLQVDASLEKMVESGGAVVREDDDVQLTDAQSSVIREARAGLGQIKEAIVEFIASQWNYDKLSDVPDLMSSVRGALLMVPVPRAAELLEACRGHVEAELTGKSGAPDWPMLDTLADAITSIDYYLERLAEDPKRPDERILDLAEESVAKLRGGPQPGVADADAPTVAMDLPRMSSEATGADSQSLDEAPAAESAPQQPPPAPQTVVSSENVARSDVDAADEFLIDESFDGEAEDDIAAPQPDADAGLTIEGLEDDADVSDDDSADDLQITGRFEIVEEDDAEAENSDLEPATGDSFEILQDDIASIERGSDEDAADVSSPDDAADAEHVADASVAPDDADAPLEFIIDETFDEEDDSQRSPASAPQDDEEESSDVAEAATVIRPPPDVSDADAPDEFVLDESFDTEGAVVAGDEQPETSSSDAEDAGEASPAELELSESTVTADPEIIEIFLEEVSDVLDNLRRVLPDWINDLENSDAVGEVRRAFHTLKGSGRMVGASLVSEVAWSIENMLNRVIDGTVPASRDMAMLVSEVCDAMPILKSAFEHGTPPQIDPAPYSDRADLLASGVGSDADDVEPPPTQSRAAPEPGPLASYPPEAPTIVRASPASMDESLIEIFEEEAAGHLEIVQRCIDERGAIDVDVIRALHTLKGSAAMADIAAVVGIASPLEDFAREISDGAESQNDSVYEALQAGIDAMRASLAALRDGSDPGAAVDRFQDMLSRAEPGAASQPEPSENTAATDEASQNEEEAEQITSQAAGPQIPQSVADAAIAPPPVEIPNDADPDVLEIFFEEADELLENMDTSIQAWLDDRASSDHIDALLRALHTLKGGARLAGLAPLGDYTHAFESHLIEQQPKVGHLPEAFFSELQTRHDVLVSYVNAIKSGAPGEIVTIEAPVSSPPQGSSEASKTADEVSDEPSQIEPPEQIREDVKDAGDDSPASDDNVVPFASAVQQRDEETSRLAAREDSDQVSLRQAPQEMVRVASTLLEDLVNLAGETSIHRARVEQEVRDFGYALEETETTIERLREQLRRLELETDAQVLYRKERLDGPGYAGFDPLEMDRYSQLQQLSRSLLESATDLLDLKETLSGKTRDVEGLLMHQARINTELQEGLMRTRMVPFERLVPRLRRIVRQIGREVNKDVAFQALDAEGELDRNVLERMIPPLEHMLRNAVDHGIESGDEREAAGKPRRGNITLRLSREGGDIVLEIADDGRGIDVDKVREKAIQRGLMPEDANLADKDIMQFIMSPGFSTAQAVTQISGRGVGMDVVDSEVKMLGGEISLSSEPGKGTTFSVRLPFTVSVNRALMVSIGEDLYAIPLNTIEGIVRVLPKDLDPYLDQSVTTFEYAGARYRMRYLGSYVGRKQYTRSDALSVPVILVRAGDDSVALYVDAVQGSREIVVKGLGPQFASVGGISGATILGDGSVVVILDPPGLIRAEAAARLRPAEVTAISEQDKAKRATRVMVVDDSVTVRKVTSRVLERNGFEVMLAKDGVDAIAMLHERQPDIMLLDIEMPRMDGFEVARQVRRDDRLKNLPIVIISSRTGTKHQERARELGVNVFMGKPFQENELMKIINELVD